MPYQKLEQRTTQTRRGKANQPTTHQVGVDLNRGRPQSTVLQHAADAADSHALPQAAHYAARYHDVLHWLERITAIRGRACSRRSWRVGSSTVGLCVRHGSRIQERSSPSPSISLFSLYFSPGFTSSLPRSQVGIGLGTKQATPLSDRTQILKIAKFFSRLSIHHPTTKKKENLSPTPFVPQNDPLFSGTP